MPILSYDLIEDRGQAPQPSIWSAAAQIFLSNAAKKSLGIKFQLDHDDLDSFEIAYLNVEGVPVSLQRYQEEPDGIYTLQVDAEKIGQIRRRKVSTFVHSLLVTSWKLSPSEIVWTNKELDHPESYSVLLR